MLLSKKNLSILVTTLLMVACGVGSYWLSNATTAPLQKRVATVVNAVIVDDRLYQAARRIAPIADSAEEQALARETLRLADRELDEAFASALREATLRAAIDKAGPLKAISTRITEQRAKIEATQSKISKLTKLAPNDEDAASELDLEKAQQNLNHDDLEDLQQEQTRQGGNFRGKVDAARLEHETAEHAPIAWATSFGQPPATLWNQVAALQTAYARSQSVNDAAAQAVRKSTSLIREREALKLLAAKLKPPKVDSTAAAGEEEEDWEVMLARLRQLSDQKKTMLELDKRSELSKQLAEVYQRWDACIDARISGILQLLLWSLTEVFAVVLAVLIAMSALRRIFLRAQDRRRFHQFRIVGTITLQVIGVLLIALIIFGPPRDVSMVLGLATAGLTVALKDFILAFVGWFVLIGKNGVSLGDWVEIEGIGGEVIEIGILNTVLLEMGNWTNTGHPTGRRVSFVNKYAIEKHFFNFSTEGQWLWDELQVTLPASGNTYETAQTIRQVVEQATAEDAKQAEADWKRVTHQYGDREFSAKPALDLRPSLNGIDVIVRYITRAPQRYAVKSHLFEALVGLLKTT